MESSPDLPTASAPHEGDSDTSGKSYPSVDVAAVCAEFRAEINELAIDRPELSLVVEELDQVVRHDSDPLHEIENLFGGCRDVFLQLKRLINPISLPLHITADGRVPTTTFTDVAVLVTDIRGFTELSEQIEQRWNTSIFQVLSHCYFPYIVQVLERYACHYLNYTGDGLLALCQARPVDNGQSALSAWDNAVLCSLELTATTNHIAEAWKRMGLVPEKRAQHETGIGVTFGDVQIGDPFVPDANPTGMLAKFQGELRRISELDTADFEPPRNFNRRILGIHALSPSINRASRLQDMDKIARGFTCMMTADDLERLSPPLRDIFETVGKMGLRGIGEVEVCGFHRFKHFDLPALEKACREA